MAKKSSIEKTNKRLEIIEKFAARRAVLRATMKNVNLGEEERDAARQALLKLPRDANPNRVRLRCNLSGRSRGYLRKFGLSRIKFRELSHAGAIPGVRKASW